MIDLFYDGRTPLTAEDLNRLIGMVTAGNFFAQPPIDVNNGPDGQVTISINLEILKQMLVPEAENLDEVDEVFDVVTAPVVDQGARFEWTPVQVTKWDGLQYELTEVGINGDGSFYSLGQSGSIFFGVEFTGNPAVPILSYGWMFAAPGQDVNYFFCPELVQVVRAISNEANQAGFYPAMLQRYVHPPNPYPGDPPNDPLPPEGVPDTNGEFEDVQNIWLTLPTGIEPDLGMWMIARLVGYFDDGLAIYASCCGEDKCEPGGEVLIPTMSSDGNRTLTVPNSGLGVGHDGSLIYVRKSQDFGTYQELTICPRPATQVVIYTPPARIIQGVLYLAKTLVTLVDGQLIAAPAGVDSTDVFCVDQSSSSSITGSSVSSLSSQSAMSISSMSSLSSAGPSASSASSVSSLSSLSSISSHSSMSLSSVLDVSSQSSSSNPSLFKLDFSASTSGINIGNPSSLSFSSGITISAWISTTNGSSYPVVTKSPVSGTITGYTLYASDTFVLFEAFNSFGQMLVELGYGGLVSGNLYHVAVTVDTASPGVNGILYVNGVSVNSATAAGGLGFMDAINHNFIIGGQEGTSLLWPGTIDAVRVYRAALLDGQITELYNSGAGLGSAGTASAILQGWWKFDEEFGASVIDSSSFGNNGVINGQTYQSATVLG